MTNSPAQSGRPKRGLPTVWLVLFALGLVIVPYLFWQGTWFGRPLTDAKMTEYLRLEAKPRHTQHALSQLADRIVRGDASASRWYPQVVAMSKSTVPEVRLTAAWVMGQDNRHDPFHQALVPLVSDPEPMVRRNVALALVRFHDKSGRPVLVEMLRPFHVPAPRAGELVPRLKVDDTVSVHTLLARIQTGGAEATEIRSPVPGTVQRWLVPAGSRVAQGDAVVVLEPQADQVWEALRALYLVGEPDDLPDVEKYLRPRPDFPESVPQQARLTADAIRKRKT